MKYIGVKSQNEFDLYIYIKKRVRLKVGEERYLKYKWIYKL